MGNMKEYHIAFLFQYWHFSGKDSFILPYTHVLDLADFGFIKPHIDSPRVGIFYLLSMLIFAAQFCGSTVAVLSLLSPCVARFRLDKDRDQVIRK